MNYWIKKKLQVIEEAFDSSYCLEIEKVTNLLISHFQSQHLLMICGNGGSAADAQHIAAEFVGRFQFDRPGLPAIALGTNPATLTAWSNDHDFDTIFARQVECFGKPGDVLWGISTSGRSRNVIKALQTAKEKGLITIGMAGNDGGMMSSFVDYPLFVNDKNTACVQEIHLITYHRICELVEARLFASHNLKEKVAV